MEFVVGKMSVKLAFLRQLRFSPASHHLTVLICHHHRGWKNQQRYITVPASSWVAALTE